MKVQEIKSHTKCSIIHIQSKTCPHRYGGLEPQIFHSVDVLDLKSAKCSAPTSRFRQTAINRRSRTCVQIAEGRNGTKQDSSMFKKLGCVGVFGTLVGVGFVVGIIEVRMVRYKGTRKGFRFGEVDEQELNDI